MAWISGLDIFDRVLNGLLDPTMNLKMVIQVLMKEFESRGCDVIQNSSHFSNPIVREAYTELHPDWNKKCSCNHELITYSSESCPLCAALNKIESLKDACVYRDERIEILRNRLHP